MKSDKWLRRGITFGCLLFCSFMVGMQCHARTQCRDEQGAAWDLINGTVCFGERS